MLLVTQTASVQHGAKLLKGFHSRSRNHLEAILEATYCTAYCNSCLNSGFWLYPKGFSFGNTAVANKTDRWIIQQMTEVRVQWASK